MPVSINAPAFQAIASSVAMAREVSRADSFDHARKMFLAHYKFSGEFFQRLNRRVGRHALVQTLRTFFSGLDPQISENHLSLWLAYAIVTVEEFPHAVHGMDLVATTLRDLGRLSKSEIDSFTYIFEAIVRYEEGKTQRTPLL